MNDDLIHKIDTVYELEKRLNNLARTLGAVIGPDFFRILNLKVHVGKYSTASMGGSRISMPEFFYGSSLIENVPLAVGLLAHELGHFLQPLRETTALVEAGLVTAWLENLVLDVAGESFLEKALPGLSYGLRVPRQLIHDKLYFVYLAGANNKDAPMCRRMESGLLASRFLYPASVFSANYRLNGSRVQSLCRDVTAAMHLLPSEIPAFLLKLSKAYPELMEVDPESEKKSKGQGNSDPSEGNDSSRKQTDSEDEKDEGEDSPKEEGSDKGGSSEESNDEAGENDNASEDLNDTTGGKGDKTEPEIGDGETEESGETSSAKEVAPEPSAGSGEGEEGDEGDEEDGEEVTHHIPDELAQMLETIVKQIVDTGSDYSAVAKPIISIPPTKKVISPELDRLSKTIQVRFGQPQGKSSIVAPGYIVRREMALGDPTPYRMDVKGNKVEGPNVLIFLDESGSMSIKVPNSTQIKHDVARMAAQAVSLAVVRAGGRARGGIFATHAAMADQGNMGALWQGTNVSGMADRRTTFLWLTEAWEKYPDPLFIIITDGKGAIPKFVSQHNKNRTVAVVIPPGDAAALAPICSKVVELSDVMRLSSVLSTLIPRTTR